MAEAKSPYITLTQFLKLNGFASTGGQAKYLVKELDITVNGIKEDRRGKKLYPGDIVIVNGRKFVIE